jgi:hypothetical protein
MVQVVSATGGARNGKSQVGGLLMRLSVGGLYALLPDGFRAEISDAEDAEGGRQGEHD